MAEARRVLLEVRNVSAGYGELKVLWDISVAVGEGEFVAMIGANGAGKSTLMRVITGILPAKSGSIWYDGRAITNWPTHQIARQGIAYVPEGRHLFGPLSVAENLQAGCYSMLRQSSARDRLSRLEKVLALFPILRTRYDQRADTLSGGEQQMLAVARGLMSAPRILVIDEPSLGLAPLVVQSLGKVLQEINERESVSILLVEQNARIALSVAKRVYVLERGKIMLEGATSELASDERIKDIYLSREDNHANQQ